MAGQEVVILVSCPATDSLKIADALVKAELAACVNILPAVKSIYRWQGDICVDAEELLVIKSGRGHFSELCRKVKELHPYEVPEIIQIPIEDGYKPYIDWLNAGLKQHV
jgi:periplasmic divalent cation tolerance protein